MFISHKIFFLIIHCKMLVFISPPQVLASYDVVYKPLLALSDHYKPSFDRILAIYIQLMEGGSNIGSVTWSRCCFRGFFIRLLLMEQCCNFAEFLWHKNRLNKKISSISSFHPVITAGRQAWVCEWWRMIQPWLAYRLCLSLRDEIFCHPAVWIFILNCLTVVESHCQLDMTHCPAGSLFPDQFVCYGVIFHWPTVLRQDGLLDSIRTLMSSIHCCSLYTQLSYSTAGVDETQRHRTPA